MVGLGWDYTRTRTGRQYWAGLPEHYVKWFMRKWILPYFNDVNTNTSFRHKRLVTGLMFNFKMSFIWCLFSLYELWTEIFNTSNVVDPSKTAKWSIKGATHSTDCVCTRDGKGTQRISPLVSIATCRSRASQRCSCAATGRGRWATVVTSSARSSVRSGRTLPSATVCASGTLCLRAYHAICRRNWEWGWWEGGVPGASAARWPAGGDHLQGSHLWRAHCHRRQLRTATNNVVVV